MVTSNMWWEALGGAVIACVLVAIWQAICQVKHTPPYRWVQGPITVAVTVGAGVLVGSVLFPWPDSMFGIPIMFAVGLGFSAFMLWWQLRRDGA